MTADIPPLAVEEIAVASAVGVGDGEVVGTGTDENTGEFEVTELVGADEEVEEPDVVLEMETEEKTFDRCYHRKIETSTGYSL